MGIRENKVFTEREREREREREIERERERDRQTDRQTETETKSQTNRQKKREKYEREVTTIGVYFCCDLVKQVDIYSQLLATVMRTQASVFYHKS